MSASPVEAAAWIILIVAMQCCVLLESVMDAEVTEEDAHLQHANPCEVKVVAVLLVKMEIVN